MPITRKIKQQISKSRKQASRFKQPPPKLKALIELVNCFPPDGIELTVLHPANLKAQAVAMVKEMLGKDDVESDLYKIKDYFVQPRFFFEATHSSLIEENIASLPSKLKDYILHGRPKGRDRMNETLVEGGIINRYLNVWNARMRLHRMAQLVVQEPGVYRETSILWEQPLPLPVLDKIDEQGFVRVSKDLFTEAMDEDDIEAVRIRECEACNRIFWAGRITQKGCSARCGDVIRKRRYRERYRQGFYQGAKLTDKDKAALTPQKKRSSQKKGE